MRKIDLTPYQSGDMTFQMRESLVAVLFNESKLDGREILRRDELARKIETHPTDTLLIEESDYNKILKGLQATDLQPHGRSVVTFLTRVLDAPEVQVKEDSSA